MTILWKLHVREGRQWWEPIETDEVTTRRGVTELEEHLITRGVNDPDNVFEFDEPLFESPKESLKNSINFFNSIITEDGHWTGDYAGPMFLLPGFLIVYHLIGILLPKPFRDEMIKYLINTQNKVDGGWGLHIEDKSTIFGTVLNYVSLRILGLEADHVNCKKARKFILDNGGAVGIPQWGKFWLCVLNCFDYSGLDPIPPELFLLPSWLPFHPSKWWCHTRAVYIGMAYLYGVKAKAKETPLILELRKEIFVEKYENIKWTSIRSYVNPLDIYVESTWVWKILVFIIGIYEWIHSTWIRNYCQKVLYEHLKYEDVESNFICIGPVNKAMNMLACYLTEGNSEDFKKHEKACFDYFWLSKDGMKVSGEPGSQLWDVALGLQAYFDHPGFKDYLPTVNKALDFVDISQCRKAHPESEKFFRHKSKGGWPFTFRDQGWIVSDCTAEGLKTILLAKKKGVYSISDDRIRDAVDVILSLQNKTGGWATYEETRGSELLEYINPASVFKNIMIDYDHIECSSSCVQALVLFREQFKSTPAIDEAIKRGITFIKSIQTPDGGWYGNWAVCYTYGTWFAVKALMISGEDPKSPIIKKACEFLVKNQMKDGGWGESYLSCVKGEYISTKNSQVVNTAWALCTLMMADYQDKNVIDRGIKVLMRRQQKNGDWIQEAISGVFNGNCMISYANYKNIFPIWALSLYCAKYQ
jgi:lanosterol synthase